MGHIGTRDTLGINRDVDFQPHEKKRESNNRPIGTIFKLLLLVLHSVQEFIVIYISLKSLSLSL